MILDEEENPEKELARKILFERWIRLRERLTTIGDEGASIVQNPIIPTKEELMVFTKTLSEMMSEANEEFDKLFEETIRKVHEFRTNHTPP